MATALVLTQILVKLLTKIGWLPLALGGVMIGIALAVPEKLSDPTARLWQGIGVAALGATALIAVQFLKRFSLWAEPFLFAIGIGLTWIALTMDIPESLGALPQPVARAVLVVCVAVWWAMTFASLWVCWRAGRPRGAGPRPERAGTG